MPHFGIRWLDYSRSLLTGKDKVPYDDWNVYDYFEPVESFEAAKKYAQELEDAERPQRYAVDEEGNLKRNRWGETMLEPDPNAKPHTRYMAFKLPGDTDYMKRETARIEAGDYVPLPDKMWPYGNKNDYNFAFPRLIPATDDTPAQIGYYESARKAMYNQLKTQKATRYFATFFDESEMWDMLAELGLVKAGLTLAFATTREDIRFVYENGPESCMSGTADRYYSADIHPVEAYASPDLELAFLYRGNEGDWRNANPEDGTIVARALCNRNTKEWVRIYGDVKRMEKALEEAGYDQNQWCLGGCRVLKLYGTRDGRVDKRTVMTPYLDGACTYFIMKSDKDEYITIREEERLFSGNTSGYNRL
jgi:hypothetical protein